MSGRRVRKSVVLEPLSGDQMAGRQVLTVVVNLVVAPDGRLLYGTVIVVAIPRRMGARCGLN